MIDFDPTTDWTEPSPEKAEAIRAYFDKGSDRADDEPNPLFAGRDDILDGIRSDLIRLRESAAPLKNLTHAVYGAPGSGKSEALTQLAAMAAQWTEGDSPVLAVWGGRGCLTDPVELAAAVHYAHAGTGTALETRSSSTLIGVNLGAITYSRSWAKEQSDTLGAPGTLAAVAGACDNPTVLLLVDEAQAELDGVRARDLPLKFHKGETAGLKILPVYGGLGDTMDRLADAGVSRLSEGNAHRMEPLTAQVAGDLCRKALCALAHPTDKHLINGWAASIVDRCDGWPMHLTNCLRAARKRHLATPERLFSDTDFNAAMARADELRDDYYESRLSRCPELELSQYESWGRLFSDGAVVSTPTVAATFGIDLAYARGLLDKALRAGLVESSKTHLYTSPIPSMAQHVAERGRKYARTMARQTSPGR